MNTPLHSAVLLAGGRSRRMGTDKAFLNWKGRLLWRHQWATLEATHPRRIFLSCAPAMAARFPDVATIPDTLEDAGPMAGIGAAMDQLDEPLLLVLAVDVPLVTPALLQTLLDKSTECSGCVPIVRGHFEPAIAVYPKLLRDTVRALLNAGRYGLQPLLHDAVEQGILRAWPVPPDTAAQFRNINTPTDL